MDISVSHVLTGLASVFVTYSVRDKIDDALGSLFKRRNGNGKYVGKLMVPELKELVRESVGETLAPIFQQQLDYLKNIAESTAQTRENTAVLLDRK